MLRIIFPLFFLSGFSALIFEVAWIRELSLTLGNTAQATSAVLAVFLGGLALGAFLGGKFSQKLKFSPLATYGVLEITVGLVALLVSLALQSAGTVYVWLYHSLPLGDAGIMIVRLIVSIVLLLLPTLLMGSTLPVLVRYLEDHAQSARLFSYLYGMNTLGAAAGSLAGCFLGFPYIGLQGTLSCAAAINIIIGAFSLYLSRQPGEEQSPLPNNEAVPVQKVESPAVIVPLPVLCAISFLTGFTALNYEVLWVRILRCYLTSLTYSFTVMISMFLLGLAIGSFIYESRVLKERNSGRDPYVSFGTFQYMAALACAASLPVMLISVKACAPLQSLASIAIRTLYSHLEYQLKFMFVVSALTILIPAILIGILFPMIGTLAASRASRAASSVGTVYALNTIGCVAGSLICGLILVPAIGSHAAFQWTVLLSTVTGALAFMYAKTLPRAARMALTTLPVILACGYLTLHFAGAPRQPGATVLAEKEDATGYMRVITVPGGDGINLELNGSSLSGTSLPARRYTRLLAHLPILLHSHPEDVLVACFGTGTTCGAAAIYPEVKHLDLVEISKMVLGAAPLFRATNYDVLDNPKVSAHLMDVRNYLLTTDKSYDIITFEPPPPTEAGIVNLYTEEFYQLASSRLKQDGLVCQWIPMHQVSERLWKMQIASARAVFPYVSVWLPNSQEAILIASKQPIKIDFQEMQRRIDASPQVKASLKDVGFDNAMAVLSTYVVSGSPLDEYIQDSPSITDNHPVLEFFLPYEGPVTRELQATALGLVQVKEYVAANEHRPGFDKTEFWKNRQAIHALQEIENTPLNSQAEADLCIDKAVSLMPDNNWMKYVNSHRRWFYPQFALNFRQ